MRLQGEGLCQHRHEGRVDPEAEGIHEDLRSFAAFGPTEGALAGSGGALEKWGGFADGIQVIGDAVGGSLVKVASVARQLGSIGSAWKEVLGCCENLMSKPAKIVSLKSYGPSNAVF